MKLRTSYFNGTVLKKDITRFFPLWVLYLVGLLLAYASLGFRSDIRVAQAVAETLRWTSVANLAYALLAAELLFGDLFSPRMCNALHAMPLRRECWFFTHLLAGLLFSLVPNLLISLLLLPTLGQYMAMAGWWLLGMTLQYLFFFALAVLSALCVGSRFAMAVVYGLLNFLSMILYWLVDTLYEPLLYGVQISSEPFYWFCPVVQMCREDFVHAIPTNEFTAPLLSQGVHTTPYPESWIYAAICAGLGLGMLVLALRLYQKRPLECAGDFIAFRPLRPVFLGIYTVTVGALFHMFGEMVELAWLFLGAGIAVGFFTGRMLLQRAVKVFQPKALAAFGCVAAALVLSMVITWLDPLGITRYIPPAEQVDQVAMDASIVLYRGTTSYTKAEDISQVIDLHQAALAEGQPQEGNTCPLCLKYQLKDGRTIERIYNISVNGTAAQKMKAIMGRPQVVLGADTLDAILAKYQMAYVDGYYLEDTGQHLLQVTDDALRSLLEAMFLDSQEGNLDQVWYLHPGGEDVIAWINLTDAEESIWQDVRIFSTSRHTADWLQANAESLLVETQP